MKIILNLNSICVSYKNIQVLFDINIEVKDSEIVCLLGSNGAGKSTLASTIMGLVRPMSGSIIYKGDRIDSLPTHEIVEAGISLIPERRQLFSYMSVMDNLRLGAYSHKARERMDDSLEYVFQLFPILKMRLNQTAGTMSGGEQQMLAVGRGLMSSPQLLIMDEPSLGLAPIIVTQLFEIIRKVNDTGTAVLLVEQNVYASLEAAERGYVLEHGTVILSGTANEIKEEPYVRTAFLGL